MKNKRGEGSARPAKKGTAKRPPLFVYLGYILAATVLATGVTLSGYVSTTMGSDQARVAKFEIEEPGYQEVLVTADLIPGEQQSQVLEVQNKSEVAVEYTIAVKNTTGNLPLTFTVDSVGETSGEFSYTAVLQPNDSKRSYTLQVIWPKEKNSPEYAGMVDLIKVTVSAIQKD